ncbi:hypothetical protein BY996DRAFT_8377921, partial [Phakopsora pachyrhizi]
MAFASPNPLCLSMVVILSWYEFLLFQGKEPLPEQSQMWKDCFPLIESFTVTTVTVAFVFVFFLIV